MAQKCDYSRCPVTLTFPHKHDLIGALKVEIWRKYLYEACLQVFTIKPSTIEEDWHTKCEIKVIRTIERFSVTKLNNGFPNECSSQIKSLYAFCS